MTGPETTYQARDLAAFLSSALKALDVPEADADIVARLMTQADLLGYDTHDIYSKCRMITGTLRRIDWHRSYEFGKSRFLLFPIQ